MNHFGSTPLYFAVWRKSCKEFSREQFSVLNPIRRLPLIPAFSLGEKENCFRALRKIYRWVGEIHGRKNRTYRRLFPLPAGEGQGEGEVFYLKYLPLIFAYPLTIQTTGAKG